MRSDKVENVTLAGKSAFETSTHLPMETETKSSELQIVVLYTTPEMTIEALRHAAVLGIGLNTSVRVVDIEVVPYAYSLDRPPIDPKFLKRRLEKLGLKNGTSIQAEILYARDRDEALVRRLSPGSLVLIPVKGFWSRIFQRRLIRNLIQHGHRVVLIPCK